ncbi:hypothetical protein CLOM_g7163 [Closterium sp. NIES-68]|nr:hypothetical protein CLOM_g7163 [Closterium sp. NIES-68]GJP78967.1 hypothetical protein CLOP_g9224 [Closterium sp. NIES-67]
MADSSAVSSANAGHMAPLPEDLTEAGQKLLSDVQGVMERCKALQETAAGYSQRLKSEGDALGERAIALEKELRVLRKSVNVAAAKDEVSPEVAEQMDEDLVRARSMVYEGDIAALLPHKANGFFLWLFLGHVNVRSSRRDVRFKVKEEYNSYRDRTALIFLGAPLLLLAAKQSMNQSCLPGLVVHVYQAWLLLFYTSLALRENILRINGSDIRPWWIYHHYYAMLMALVSLTWGIEGPDCAMKQQGITLFLMWAIIQGVAMLLQNRYQRRRLYTRIALGKAGQMDVVWGETAGMKGQLVLLYPLLFILQLFQLYIGVTLLRTSLYEMFEWQIFACGILLIIMAVGNFTNTVATVATKLTIKAKMRKKGGGAAAKAQEASSKASASAHKDD